MKNCALDSLNIKINSNLLTHFFRSYNSLSRTCYNRFKINNSIEFLSEKSLIHTNNVKRVLKDSKEKICLNFGVFKDIEKEIKRYEFKRKFSYRNTGEKIIVYGIE